VIDVAHRFSRRNALKTYDIDDRSRSRNGERQRRTWRNRHGHRCDDAVGGAVWDALAARTTEERYNAPVRLIRAIEAARAWASSQAGYFAPCRRADRRVALGHVVHVDHNLR
jgi:hypothetical protein